MTKDEVLSEIRRVAGERGGRVGLTAFLKATGIPQSQILDKHWATWNEALTDAGISITRFGQPKTEKTSVVEAVAQLIARLQKWPTEDEFTLARRRDSSFPGLRVIRRLRQSGSLAAAIVAHCANRPDLEPAAKNRCHATYVRLGRRFAVWARSRSRLRLHDALWPALQDRPHQLSDSPPS